MSDLFYANLGIGNYNYEQNNAYYRFRDFIDFLWLAINNEEGREYSITWRPLKEEDIEQIIRSKFLTEFRREEPYNEMDEITLVNLIEEDTELQTKLQYKIQEQNEKFTKDKQIWIRIYEKKRTEQGYKLIQNFFRVREVYDNKNLQDLYRIRVIDKESNYNALLLEKKPKNSEKIFLKYRAVTLRCQLDAMFQLQKRPSKINVPLLKLIMNKYFAGWPEIELTDVNKWFLLTEDDREGIEKQRKFVKLGVSTPDFAILEGPPGSGKTFSICELILQAIKRNERVLLCASTHVAVDNVLEKIKDHPSVIAIRIGKDNVSEKVRDCQLDQIEHSESRKIKNRLLRKKKKGRLTPSQDYLLECIESGKTKIISDIFLEAANLICGTTIGILKHPEINYRSTIQKTTYDYLILDEASKTTFQEFLVPALFAKKWIIVGDYRQLSPYIDPEEIEGNLNGVLHIDFEKICTNIFESYFFSQKFKNRVRQWKNQLIIEEDQELRDYYEQQAQFLNLNCIKIEDKAVNNLELLAAQVIIGSHDDLEQIEDDLPINIHLIRGECNLNRFLRRREYWIKNFHSKLNSKDYKEERNWAYQLAWRLIRAYETRVTQENNQYYMNQVEGLYPHFSILDDIKNQTDSLKDFVIKKVDLVKRIALPSIIESIQKGVKKAKNQKYSYILSDGFDEEVLKERHVLLEYQYRMHEDIAKFPSKYIYEGTALKNSKKTNRDWEYPRYSGRLFWVNTFGAKDEDENSNISEVQNILNELQHFIRWAEHNQKKEGKIWEIAVLTFYSAQERLIRKELQKFFNTRKGRYFRYPRKNISIELCVVDRFQGHEADVVFLSFVQTKQTGFLNSVNRLNVAITRAKYQLVIFGRYYFYEKRVNSKLLRNLAQYCKGNISYPKYKRS
ncbi:hypothetical protein LCGC14_1220260 [marine sediment metagenome]|uniref:Helicase ATP-binding domain-containing protein n=1 Tax=marine sediment metagenome TaxID=412755 RepID=A0A0F9LFH9_9ZZZZ